MVSALIPAPVKAVDHIQLPSLSFLSDILMAPPTICTAWVLFSTVVPFKKVITPFSCVIVPLSLAKALTVMFIMPSIASALNFPALLVISSILSQ